MNIDRRHLVLPALAVGLLGIAPTLAASADEDAGAKRVEAFRVAQVAADAKAFDALCAAELSYSHSDGRVEDKATFIANATNGKSKFLSLEYLDPQIRVVCTAAIVRLNRAPEQIAVGDLIEFSLGSDREGRLLAKEARIIDPPGSECAPIRFGDIGLDEAA